METASPALPRCRACSTEVYKWWGFKSSLEQTDGLHSVVYLGFVSSTFGLKAFPVNQVSWMPVFWLGRMQQRAECSKLDAFPQENVEFGGLVIIKPGFGDARTLVLWEKMFDNLGSLHSVTRTLSYKSCSGMTWLALTNHFQSRLNA